MFVNPPRQYTGQTINIPGGTDGIRATLYLMRRLVNDYKSNLSVVQAARFLTCTIMQKDWTGEVNAIFQFVRDEIRYVHDVEGVETIFTPDVILETKQGDCDDKSLILATLLASIGYNTRFVAVGPTPNNFQHVYVEVYQPRLRQWIALESTEPVLLGTYIKLPYKIRVEN